MRNTSKIDPLDALGVRGFFYHLHLLCYLDRMFSLKHAAEKPLIKPIIVRNVYSESRISANNLCNTICRPIWSCIVILIFFPASVETHLSVGQLKAILPEVYHVFQCQPPLEDQSKIFLNLCVCVAYHMWSIQNRKKLLFYGNEVGSSLLVELWNTCEYSSLNQWTDCWMLV